jgi:hypothetical protein
MIDLSLLPTGCFIFSRDLDTDFIKSMNKSEKISLLLELVLPHFTVKGCAKFSQQQTTCAGIVWPLLSARRSSYLEVNTANVKILS